MGHNARNDNILIHQIVQPDNMSNVVSMSILYLLLLKTTESNVLDRIEHETTIILAPDIVLHRPGQGVSGKGGRGESRGHVPVTRSFVGHDAYPHSVGIMKFDAQFVR